MITDVSVVRCSNYNDADGAVNKALGLIGGIASYVKKGDKVLIKPNLVLKKAPEIAATTHPEIVKAVVLAVQNAGGIPIIADSPGGMYNVGVLKATYKICGLEDVAISTGATLNFDTAYEETQNPEGVLVKTFPIIKPALEADVIINLPKLKTHAMTFYTGAVKNLFGLIPGTYKAEYHFRLEDKKNFCDMLLDLCHCKTPTLNIMDAVIGMQGDGPTSGEPRFIGAILASANPYALDVVATHLVGISKDEVYTVSGSIERGLTPETIDKINLLGDDISPIIINDFKRPSTNNLDLLEKIPLPETFKRWAINNMKVKPTFDASLCVGCSQCERVCPPKAITMKEHLPQVDMNKCIRCFCCHELCPKKAVVLKRNWLMELILKL